MKRSIDTSLFVEVIRILFFGYGCFDLRFKVQ